MKRSTLYALAFAIWTAGACWLGWEWRDRSADIAKLRQDVRSAEVAIGALNEALEVERNRASTMAGIGTQHEEDRRDAETVPAAVVYDLRAGNLKLRDDLAVCHTAKLSQGVAGTIERDAHAQLRGEVAGALVQVGRDADDQLRAAQAVIKADRE